jgi:parallel beta-helix repeat protein
MKSRPFSGIFFAVASQGNVRMITFRHLLAAGLMLGSLCLPSGNARAAQSLDTCIGFIDTVPTTVSTPGVWCLRHDVSTSVTSGSAINIAANNVTIDCNDFKIGGLAAGAGSNTVGIAASNRLNSTVRNCSVRGFIEGVFLSGSGHLVENNRFDQNLFIGIYVTGDNNRISDNAVYDTGGGTVSPATSYGIFASGDVNDNTVANVFAIGNPNASTTGLRISGVGARVTNNVVRGLTFVGAGVAYGIDIYSADVTVSYNTIASAAQTSGRGIYGQDGNTTCVGNIIARFTTPFFSCLDGGGNVSH